MKLVDVLELVSESTNVAVVDCETDELLGYYDGKDSIDEELNDRELVSISVQDSELFLAIL